MLPGKITAYDGHTLTIRVPFNNNHLMEQRKYHEAEVRLIDARQISLEQRKKCYALLRDISNHTGHYPDELKEYFKYDFISKTGYPDFSLSDADVTTARLFIDFLIEFCLIWDVPCRDSLLDHAQDISRYLYLCIYHKKCCICGKKSDLHHVDHVGAGRNRREICHEGMRAMALCRKHHNEVHVKGQISFDNIYHIWGIELDGILCKKLKLKCTESEVVNSE